MLIHSIYVRTTGGALNLPAVLAGAVVAFLLLTLLIAGIIVGVVLLGRAKRKVRLSQSNMTPPKSGRTEIHRAAEVHIYDVVGDNTTSIDGRAGLYQGLDVGTQDYVSMYTQLRGGTYQELDLKGREEEHHYQRAHTNRERKECGRRDQL